MSRGGEANFFQYHAYNYILMRMRIFNLGRTTKSSHNTLLCIEFSAPPLFTCCFCPWMCTLTNQQLYLSERLLASWWLHVISYQLASMPYLSHGEVCSSYNRVACMHLNRYHSLLRQHHYFWARKIMSIQPAGYTQLWNESR